MSTAKEELTRFIEGQTDDRSAEEIIRELTFHVMIQRGLVDSGAGRVVSDEEMRRRIRSWQKYPGRPGPKSGSTTYSSTARRIVRRPPLARFKPSTTEHKTSSISLKIGYRYVASPRHVRILLHEEYRIAY